MRIPLVIIVAALLAAGCGSRPESRHASANGAAESVERVDVAATGGCKAGEQRRLGDRRSAYAASIGRATAAYARPGGKVVRTFGRLNVNGFPTIFGVLGAVLDGSCEPTWYHVQLPIRPNGATGYVRAADVQLHRVRTRIEIDLSERKVELLRDGRVVMRALAAVGSSATPTPTGRYYVNQRLRPVDRSGPFGPAAIGVSAFSPVLTGWAQGGPIAIHGTNDPGSVGKAVSNGCVRLPNATLERFYEATPAGTPVVIRT